MQTNRQGFLELLQRYMDGTCSSEEQQIMDYWYDLIDQAYDEKKANTSRDQLEALLWANIQHRTQVENATKNRQPYKNGGKNSL